MHRTAGYSESWELTYLIEQLREVLAAEPLPVGEVVQELEEVLSRLVLRNQRLRVLHRLAKTESANEHATAIRFALEQLDQELQHQLPGLLERLRASK